jgi:hypothetical protein
MSYWKPLAWVVLSPAIIMYGLAFGVRLMFVLFGVIVMDWFDMPVTKRWDVLQEGLVFLFLGPEYDIFSSQYPHPPVVWYFRPFYALHLGVL